MSSVTMTVSQVRDSGGSHRDSSSRERQELGKQGPGREPRPPESQLVAAGKFTSGGGRSGGGGSQEAPRRPTREAERPRWGQ